MLWWVTWSLPPATGTYADLQRASWRWRRCGLAASAVRGAVHGGHSWVHHYSVLYRNSIFRVQYFSTCDISESVFRYPLGCVPVSRLLHTINRCKYAISYSHIDSFRGNAPVSCYIRYICIRSYSARQLSYRITSCILHTCCTGISNTSLYVCYV